MFRQLGQIQNRLDKYYNIWKVRSLAAIIKINFWKVQTFTWYLLKFYDIIVISLHVTEVLVKLLFVFWNNGFKTLRSFRGVVQTLLHRKKWFRSGLLTLNAVIQIQNHFSTPWIKVAADRFLKDGWNGSAVFRINISPWESCLRKGVPHLPTPDQK